jgi:malonyl-CoA/methylmalonyl-CoA synthetase
MVEVAGPNVFGGYWRREDANAAAFTADGFFITGDLGLFDADGYLSLVGRETDLIISGGLNVYPTEVEQLIALVPGVVDVAVVGVPHPDFGEAVIAIVVADDTYAEDELLATTRNGLANFKRPKTVFTVDELPRNALGKVQKALLRQTYANTFVNG